MMKPNVVSSVLMRRRDAIRIERIDEPQQPHLALQIAEHKERKRTATSVSADQVAEIS